MTTLTMALLDNNFPPSLNRRLHWRARSALNIAWKNHVYWHVMEQKTKMGKMPYPWTDIKIIYYACRPMDWDNAYTSAKPLVDGLKVAGVIEDDSPKHIELLVRTIKVAHLKEQKIEIIITQKNVQPN